jgi:hypothetical protein
MTCELGMFEDVSRAIRHFDVAGLRRLFESGVSPDIGGGASRERPLHIAVSRKMSFRSIEPLVNVILAAGASIDGVDKYGRSALYWAAEKDFAEACEYLVQNGADISWSDGFGTPALQVAVRFEAMEAMCALISLGADVNHTNNEDVTALHEAACYDNIDAARLLVASGAAPSFVPDGRVNPDYLTPCQVAVANGSARVLRYFVFECGESLAQASRDNRSLRELAKTNQATANLLSLETELAVLAVASGAPQEATPARKASLSL